MASRGVPGALRMDNGPEFVALWLRGLCHRRGINPAYIEPGPPQRVVAEALAEWVGREFPFPASRRVPGWGGVLIGPGRAGPPKHLAALLERGASALEFGVRDAQ